MEATKKNNTWIWSTIIGWLLVFALVWVCYYYWPKYQQMCANNVALQSENKTFKNAYGTLTTENRSLQLNEKSLRAAFGDTVAQLSKNIGKVRTITQTKTEVRIDTIKEVFEKPIPCAFHLADSVKKTHYSFDYAIDSTGITWTNIKIPNTQTTIDGYKRKSFFHPWYPVSQVTNSNPYVITTNVKSAEKAVPGTSIWGKIIPFALGGITAKYLSK